MGPRESERQRGETSPHHGRGDCLIFPRTGRRLPCTARSQRPDRRPATGLLSSSACFWEAGHTQFWKAGFGRDVCALSLNAKGWENPSSVPIDPSSEHWDLPAPGSHLHPSARLGPARPRHAAGGGLGASAARRPCPSPARAHGRGEAAATRAGTARCWGKGTGTPRPGDAAAILPQLRARSCGARARP